MSRNYRSPRIHVAGITSILLKGFIGLSFDYRNGFQI